MQKHNFDLDWRFKLGDPLTTGWRLEDVADWQPINLPHDWSIGLERSADNPCGTHGGFFRTGMGWYRKSFKLPGSMQGKHVRVEFEGVYMNAEVWLNEHLLGRHPYGYTSFTFDLTPYLNEGEQENVMYVSVDNATQRNSRWYSGSGIYRHVWLWVAEPVHIAHWGTSVTTPVVSPEKATVNFQTTLCNETAEPCVLVLQTRIVAPDGTSVGSHDQTLSLDAGEKATASQDIKLITPDLWSPEHPILYHAHTNLISSDKVMDTSTTVFGIRSLVFNAAQGFLLNGQPELLRGGCVHHDDGILGAASYDRAEERKVEVLKASGFNAIRCAHNPPSPAFLDACDRLGMLVIDEAFDCWRVGKNTYDYHVSFDDWWQRDMDSMVLRDRNHPSIIMWSIGNEVYERSGHSGGAAIAAELADYVRALDPTRPVTAAVNGSGGHWAWPLTDALFNVLDVGGYNYQMAQYAPDHVRAPERVMVGTESTPGEAFEHWMAVLDNPYIIGDFVWTSLDYLGESGIGRVHFEDTDRTFLGEYPWHQANCGDLDVCGFKRPQSFYRDILWERGEKISMFVHEPVPEGKTPHITFWGWPDVTPNWTWPGYEGQMFTVDVYGNFDAVELFLNHESVGRAAATKQERFTSSFEVPYTPGILKAVGIKDGMPVISKDLITTGAPSRIRMSPDRHVLQTQAGDLSFITVEVTDAAGNLNQQANHPIYFTLKGPGTLLAVGNSDSTSTEMYVGNCRSVYHGRCLVVVKSSVEPGEIRLSAMANGLDGAEVIIQVR